MASSIPRSSYERFGLRGWALAPITRLGKGAVDRYRFDATSSGKQNLPVSRKCPGGEIIKQEGFPSLRPMILHRLLLAAASVLCLAVAGISALGAEHNFDGVYTG